MKQLQILPILLIVIIIITFIIYLYSTNKEAFENNTISQQIINQLSTILNISPRRIINLQFDSNQIPTGTLYISFDILDPNISELFHNEKTAQEVSNIYNQLVSFNNLKIKINNNNVLIQKKIYTTEQQNDAYFNNKDLLEISKYATKKYQVVPTDKSITGFYKLTMDKDFKIKPQL